MSQLYASCSGISGIIEIRLTEDYNQPTARLEITAQSTTLAINDVVALDMGYSTSHGQVFYEEEASRKFPAGCACHDRSGSCDWCHIYYLGFPFLPEIKIVAREDGLWVQIPNAAINLTAVVSKSGSLVRREF